MKSFYEKYRDGDKITDEEVLIYRKYFEASHDALVKLGICFHITRLECYKMFDSLDSIARARGLAVEDV